MAEQRSAKAIQQPIYFSSTFVQENVDAFQPYDYTRSGNPTREAAEKAIAALEKGTYGYLFSSGMAAISNVFLTFKAGDHLVVTKNVYGGTFRALEYLASHTGLTYDYVDCQDLEAVAAAIRPETKAIYIETPSNPTLSVIDIAAIVALARRHHVLTIADNTFMSPVLQQPLTLGVDIVVHSATKFLSGHSDILAGVAITNDPALAEQIYFVQNAFGAVLGVQDAWLLQRSLQTLTLRVQQSSDSARQLAEWLVDQPQITSVYYPGLKTHSGHAIHQQQASGGGAVVSFDVGSRDNVKKLIAKLQRPAFSVSLGGVESIISYPPQMSHAELSPAEQQACGISDGFLRYSVGLEAIDELISDLAQALAAL